MTAAVYTDRFFFFLFDASPYVFLSLSISQSLDLSRYLSIFLSFTHSVGHKRTNVLMYIFMCALLLYLRALLSFVSCARLCEKTRTKKRKGKDQGNIGRGNYRSRTGKRSRGERKGEPTIPLLKTNSKYTNRPSYGEPSIPREISCSFCFPFLMSGTIGHPSSSSARKITPRLSVR